MQSDAIVKKIKTGKQFKQLLFRAWPNRTILDMLETARKHREEKNLPSNTQGSTEKD